MRKQRREKKKIYILFLIMLTMTVGIGYAVLSEQLSINSSVEYGTMKWYVGFKSAEDGSGSITSNPIISDDKKTVTITCDVGTSISSENCITNAVIENNSTFAVVLESTPTITYDTTYINSVGIIWTDDLSNIAAKDEIAANSTRELKITIITKELTEETLPSDGLSIPINITLNWVEATSIDESNKENEEITFASIPMQMGNDYSASTIDSTNRISATKNLYLEKGTAIKIKDSTNYALGIFVEESEEITYSTNYRSWSVEDYIVTETGWYGVAIKRADNADFDLDNTDPKNLEDYISLISITIKDASNYNDISMETGHEYVSGYGDDITKIAVTENIYLKAGSIIKIINPSTYLMGVFNQSGPTITSGDSSTCVQKWAATDYSVTTDGWYGIAFKKADGTNFDLEGTDPNTAGGYMIIE